MLGKRARASSAMTPVSPLSMGRLKSRSRTFRLRRWALSVWNNSVQHNTQASDTLQVGPLRVEQLCATQHAGFRHTSGGPSLCGTALCNTTLRLQTHCRWALSVWNSSGQHNPQASDTVNTLQVVTHCVKQLCTTQHMLQTQLTHFKDDHHMTAV